MYKWSNMKIFFTFQKVLLYFKVLHIFEVLIYNVIYPFYILHRSIAISKSAVSNSPHTDTHTTAKRAEPVQASYPSIINSEIHFRSAVKNSFKSSRHPLVGHAYRPTVFQHQKTLCRHDEKLVSSPISVSRSDCNWQKRLASRSEWSLRARQLYRRPGKECKMRF